MDSKIQIKIENILLTINNILYDEIKNIIATINKEEPIKKKFNTFDRTNNNIYIKPKSGCTTCGTNRDLYI